MRGRRPSVTDAAARANVGRELQAPLIARQRFPESLEIFKSDPAIEVQQRLVRGQRNGLIILFDRIDTAALFTKQGAEIQRGISIVRGQFERPPVSGLGSGRVAFFQ